MANRPPKVSGGRLPREFFGRVNLRDVFSHSPQCDQWLSLNKITDVVLSYRPKPKRKKPRKRKKVKRAN